jgi:hypothetical protein
MALSYEYKEVLDNFFPDVPYTFDSLAEGYAGIIFTLPEQTVSKDVLDAKISEMLSDLQATLDNSLPMEALRAERNRYLLESDWTQMPDSPLNETEKSEWGAYRQALRDITNFYSNADQAIWPVKPS